MKINNRQGRAIGYAWQVEQGRAASFARQDEQGCGYDQGVIPAELEFIPKGYEEPAAHQGRLELLTYATYDSFHYGEAGHEIQKRAWVYVPYGYNAAKRYDVFYLSHGGWGDETTLVGTNERPTRLKNAVDHAIEDNLIRPFLIVLLTYNNLSPKDSWDYELAIRLTANFHNELVNDLLPAVESKYATYAANTSSEGLRASRDHRAFGGFSMGSVNTWNTFMNCLPYFSMFNPMSGGAGMSGRAMETLVQQAGLGPEDFFIFSASGTSDFAYRGFKQQIEALLAAPGGIFQRSDGWRAGNVSFRERKGYEHSYESAEEYIYNAMRFFFNGKFQRDAAEPVEDEDSDLTVGGGSAATSTKAENDGSEWARAEQSSAAFEPYTVDSTVDEVRNDSAFKGYGRLIFPVDLRIAGSTTLADSGNYIPWYNYVRPERTVEICNYFKRQSLAGEPVFLRIYSDEEVAEDPWKADTGLFFFRGKPGAKTAIVNAGGGFMYVGAIHDSFPHALELSKRGCNAFALIYRPGAQTACEDLARAIAYLHEHAAELQIDMEGYSLWGGSAGGRMAAWLGAYGTRAFGERAYSRPAACIVNYTGLSDVTGKEPPTYSAVGNADGIANYRTMQRRIAAICANGTDAEIEVFPGLPHGFGLGEGTVAEGWLDHAVAFWKRQLG